MVRAGIPEAERRAWRRALGAGFVAVVGGSAAMLGLRVGASLPELAGAFAVGAAVGALLVWYVSRLGRPGEERERR